MFRQIELGQPICFAQGNQLFLPISSSTPLTYKRFDKSKPTGVYILGNCWLHFVFFVFSAETRGFFSLWPVCPPSRLSFSALYNTDSCSSSASSHFCCRNTKRQQISPPKKPDWDRAFRRASGGLDSAGRPADGVRRRHGSLTELCCHGGEISHGRSRKKRGVACRLLLFAAPTIITSIIRAVRPRAHLRPFGGPARGKNGLPARSEWIGRDL